VHSYGVQVSTLEQVFLKIGHLTDPAAILKLAVEQNEERKSVQAYGDEEILDQEEEEVKQVNRMNSAPISPSTLSFDEILRTSVDSRSSSSSSGSNPFSRSSGLRMESDSEQGRVEFSLERSETDKTFWTSLKAVLMKRANIFRSSRKYFIFETIIPGLMIIIGVIIAKYGSHEDERSPIRIFNPDMLTLKQKVLMNRTPFDQKNSDVGMEMLASNLPMGDDAFDVYFSNAKRARSDNYEIYGQSVFEFG
jgi:hypothetical protein